MTNREINSIIEDIDDDLIEKADEMPMKQKRISWVKLGSAAAAVLLIVILGVFALPAFNKNSNSPATPVTTFALLDSNKNSNSTATPVATFALLDSNKNSNSTATPVATVAGENQEGNGEGIGDPNYTGNEIRLYEKYEYYVDSGEFASYVQGRVINESKVGEKISDVTVTAGLVRPEGLPQAKKEHARAEIYKITDVSTDVAVAIKFLDKLEAELTTFYYVIVNPDADLTPVKEYVITYDTEEQNDGGIE